MRSRVESMRPSFDSPVFSRSGTLGGGGGGGDPSKTSITHLPRNTGDVRLACDVNVRTLRLPEQPATAAVGIAHAAELGTVHA